MSASTSVFKQPELEEFDPADFQIEDLKQLIDRDWSANWSEMGCYKTSTFLWMVEEKTKDIECPQVLVITTKSGKGTYFKMAPSLLPGWDILNVTTTKCKIVFQGIEVPVEFPKKVNKPTLYIAHYNVFNKRKKKQKEKQDDLSFLIEKHAAPKKKHHLDDMLAMKWDMVCLDEAHRIKGRKTGWTQNIKRIKASNRHVMTGTGFINDPSEIWSLLNFLNKGVFSSYWKFRQRYCHEVIDWESGLRKIVGVNPDHKEEFRNLVRTVGPRRTKVEVFKNLPEPIFTPVVVDLSVTQRRMYDEIKAYLQTLDQEGTPLYSPNVLSALQRQRQICVATPKILEDYYDEALERRIQKITLVEPSSKLDALMEIIQGLEWDEERKDQVVVFSNFKDPIELAKARFDKANISYLHLEQRDNDQKRYEKWGITFPKKEHQVFLTTLQLGSEAISLTSASTCVFLDRSWSPKDNEQGVSRVWRPGQENVANIIHINARRTTDQRIESVNIRKTGWFTEIFGDEEEEID